MSNKNATSGKVVFTNNNSYELKSDIRGGHGKVSYQIVDSNYNILKKDVHSAQPGNLVELIFQPDNEWAFDPGDFTFMQNNFALSIGGDIAENDKKIILSPLTGKGSQKFYVTKKENEWVSFNSVLNRNLCIDASEIFDGNCLELKHENNTIYQQFKIC